MKRPTYPLYALFVATLAIALVAAAASKQLTLGAFTTVSIIFPVTFRLLFSRAPLAERLLDAFGWLAFGVMLFGGLRGDWLLTSLGGACQMASIGASLWLLQREPEGAPVSLQPARIDTSRLTDRARAAVERAKAVAQARGNVEPQTLDLLLALADNDGGVAHHVLERASLANPGLREQLERERGSRRSAAGQSETILNELLERAGKECGPLGHRYIGTEHLLLAIAQRSPASDVAEVFAKAGVDPQSLRDEVLSLLGHPTEARS